METKNTQYAQSFVDKFEEAIEASPELTEEKKQEIISMLPNAVALSDGLGVLKSTAARYAEQAEQCDQKKRMWEESKKFWNSRSAAFIALLGAAMQKLGVKGGKVKTDEGTLSTSSRTTLEVDTDWLLSTWQQVAEDARALLPDYVTLELSVNKSKLSAHLKTDNSLLLNNPEKIHYNTSTSISLK